MVFFLIKIDKKWRGVLNIATPFNLPNELEIQVDILSAGFILKFREHMTKIIYYNYIYICVKHCLKMNIRSNFLVS